MKKIILIIGSIILLISCKNSIVAQPLITPTIIYQPAYIQRPIPTNTIQSAISPSETSSFLIQDLVGTYYFGAPLAVCSFDIESDSTFVIDWHPDGDGSRFSGKISVQNTKLILETNSSKGDTKPCFYKTFTIMYWGKRKYLLPEDNSELANRANSIFCDEVKKGNEPRSDVYGYLYLRKSDFAIKVEGNPIKQDGQLLCQ
jgi:hypothetical protein